MNNFGLRQRLLAEALGTAFLLTAVVGSGIMGERLAGGNVAIALLANTVATAAALVVLISMFGPISGAHFNPAITLLAVIKRWMPASEGMAYALVQVGAAILGVYLAHLMFGMPIFEWSTKGRDGWSLLTSEFVATFGLVLLIACGSRLRPAALPSLIGLYIGAAYWFTASTSFANPAVTFARSLSDSFAGIALHSVPAFIAAQIAGALAGEAVAMGLFRASQEAAPAEPGIAIRSGEAA